MRLTLAMGDFAYRRPYLFLLLLALVVSAVWQLLPPDPELRDHRGRTALALAAERGDASEVKRLLKAGAAVDGCDDCLWTPLMHAVANGHAEAAERLIAAGADVNARDKGGYSILAMAAGNGHAALVSRLAGLGALVDSRDDSLGWTPLIWAAREGHVGAVEVLLAAGADSSIQDGDGMSALMWATREGHGEVAERLLAIGADATLRDGKGRDAAPVRNPE